MSNPEPSILYIDDDLLSLEVMKVLLEKIMGFTNVTYFKDSQNFIERIRNLLATPDIVFLDLKIRPHDGYEILAALRNNTDYQDIKVIAVTASVMSHDVEQMKAAGFSGLISKPIIHRIFPELINKILAGEPIWYIS